MNPSPTLIGLGGRLRAGKDAVADRLVDEHGFVKLGMSDALHEAMLAIDPIIDEGGGYTQESPVTYSEAIAEYGYVETKARFPEARRLLQKLGTEVGRDMIGENVWVDIMARKVNKLLIAGRSVVVTGIRFPNEIRLIGQFAGRAIWVERPSLEAAAGGHASETSIGPDDFDRAIVNDGTLDDLYAKVDALVSTD